MKYPAETKYLNKDLFDTIPATLNTNVTSWLVYNDTVDIPSARGVDEFQPFDDFNLVPVDGVERYSAANHTITLDVKMDNLGDGAN